MKRTKRFAVAALAVILTTCLFVAAAEEYFIPAAGKAPAYYPDGGQTSKDDSLVRERYYYPAAAYGPAYFPDGGRTGEYDSGSCGTHAVYYFDKKTKVLGISIFPNVIGGGAMWDYRLPEDTASTLRLPPWHEKGYASEIKSIVFSEGVRSIGANAFYGLENVTNVTISASISFIGPGAFYGLALTNLSFLGMTPPNVERDAFHPPAVDTVVEPSIHYPVHASAAYESLLNSGAGNWDGLTHYARAPYEDIVYVPLESSENDTPMICDVEYDGTAVSYGVYVQSANSALYAGAVVRVTYNEKTIEDITLDANGKGYGSFPAQPGEANFGLALLSYPSTRANRHFKIVKPGMVNAQ